MKINELKLSPEKPYELVKPYKLAPYELAEHPCILINKTLSKVVKFDSHQQHVCAKTGDYLIPIELEQVIIKDTDFIVSGGDSLKIPNTDHCFNQIFAEGLWFFPYTLILPFFNDFVIF